MNDAIIVKRFHLWGQKNGIATSSIHDAFFANAAHMLPARDGIREIYANAVDSQSLLATLKEMRARGMPKEVYEAYLEEAKRIGLIPVAGKSIVGGQVLKESDILKREDVLVPIKGDFKTNRYFYGIG